MIQAEIIADSLSPQGHRLTTFVVTFPRIVLAEFNTHRMFSRNSASSRAIPFKKMVQMVEENPFTPLAWQKDHKGMQGTEYLEVKEGIYGVENHWLAARDKAIGIAKALNKADVTKQLCNRLLEPFMWHKVIVTSSEEGLENFFKLRCPQYSISRLIDGDNRLFRSKKDFLKELDYDPIFTDSQLDWLSINKSQAEIHIQALAECMWDGYNESTPKQLENDEWHIPFGDNFDWDEILKKEVPTEDPDLLVKVAVSRCARISYQTLGDNPVIDYEKDLELYNRLVENGHASPLEHVAVCANDSNMYFNLKGFKSKRYLTNI